MTWLRALVLLAVAVLSPAAASAQGRDALAPDRWNEIRPGGATTCARGDEYAFWVRPGTTDRVIVDFQGGGACWDERTCSVARSTFQDSVEGVRAAVRSGFDQGLYDHHDPRNPFRDDWHVVVPYCTGDVHWGDATARYGGVTIEHRGAVNARAVLAWVYRNLPRPERVLVTGCSAGAYGAALWSADVARHYPRARVIQMGDSGAGVITDSFFRDSFPAWRAERAFPSWVPELDPARVDVRALGLDDLYVAIGARHPNLVTSEIAFTEDHDQIFYFRAMGGTAPEWTRRMRAQIAEIEDRSPRFTSFVAPGARHCVILDDALYSMRVGDRRLVDWMRELADGRVPASVAP